MSKREFEGIMAFGVGIDSVSGDIRGDCVTPIVPQLSDTRQGQETTFFST